VRRPAGPHYPQPDGLHIKLTSEAYLGSLRCPLGGVVILPGQHRGREAVHRRVSSPMLNRDQGDGVGRKGQADGPGRQRPRFTASIPADIRAVGHERCNAVKHVFQARFELPLPPVLGESRR
jgi:hypothetical protein